MTLSDFIKGNINKLFVFVFVLYVVAYGTVVEAFLVIFQQDF